MMVLKYFMAPLCLSTALLIGTFGQPFDLPDIKPIKPKVKHTFDYDGKLEISGVVKSINSDNLFWILNDSGDKPRVFAIDSNGHFYKSARYDNYEGVNVGGAINVDWEDIAKDDAGNLIICDIGNNRNDRKDLVFYKIPEPSPHGGVTSVLEKIFFKYPDQKAFPDSNDFNYDAEAAFYTHGAIYVLTKHRSNTSTKLYTLSGYTPHEVNSLELIEEFNIGGMVTAADVSADGNTLLVLTYNAVWLFERENENTGFFEGKAFWLPIKATQVESICFKDENTFLVIDEATSELFEISKNQLKEVKLK